MTYTFELLTPDCCDEIEGWFDDAETQRYLGGRDWLRREPELMQVCVGMEFRGCIVLARYVWVVREEGTPVALVDVEPYDDGTAGMALVVAPKARRRGVGRRVLSLLEERPELHAVYTIIGGVDPENIAMQRCLTQAGYTISATVDDEGMLALTRRR